MPPRVLRGKKCVGHSPTRRKCWEKRCLNRGAQLCPWAPSLTRVPLCPWALQLPAPPSATWHPSRASAWIAWPPATCPRLVHHLRPARATRALPRGLSAASHLRGGPARHVSACNSRSPCQHLQVRTPFFCDFK